MGIVTFAFSLLAVTFLAATCASNSSSNHDSGIDHVESLQNMVMKRHPEVLPPYLKSKRGWDDEMAYAFSIGLVLGRAKKMVVRRRVQAKNKLKELEISPSDLNLFLTELGSSVWNERKEDSNAKTIAKGVIPLLFKMDLLSNDLEKLDEPMSFMKFRLLIAKHSVHPATMLIADVAILMWLADEIRTKRDDHLVAVHQFVLEALCALSMYSEFEEHCTNELFIILTEVQNLIHLDILEGYSFSLINIIKQLDDHSPIRKKVEEIASSYRLARVRDATSNHNYHLVCRTLLGVEHDFAKSIEKDVSSAELAEIENMYDMIADKFELHSLGNPYCAGCMPNHFFFSLSCTTFMSARAGEKDTLEWDSELEYLKKLNFASNAIQNSCTIYVISRLQLPASVVSEIKSCTDWNQLSKLRRLGLTYGMTILKTSVSPVSW